MTPRLQNSSRNVRPRRFASQDLNVQRSTFNSYAATSLESGFPGGAFLPAIPHLVTLAVIASSPRLEDIYEMGMLRVE